MANICWMKLYTDNRARALENVKGLLRCRKTSQTLVHKRLKTGPEVLPTLTILLCHSPSLTLYAALTWRPTATLDEKALCSFAAKIWNPKRCYVENAIALGGLKWQYIAIIATFSSLFFICLSFLHLVLSNFPWLYPDSVCFPWLSLTP